MTRTLSVDQRFRARIRWPIFVITVFCAVSAAAGTVWIDTDVSIGSPIREVDDAYALVLALHSPELRIAGVSTTYGNAPLGHTTRVARDIVSRFGGPAGLTETTVHSGARSKRELGRRTAASDALAATLEEGRLTYIALGPLTNLATFLQLHPRLAPRLERVIFLGGHLPGARLTVGPNQSFPIHDANVFKDPAATAIVLRSKIPLTAIPVTTASKLRLDAADLRELERSGGAGHYLARRSGIWLWFWRNIVQARGGAIFDALAIVAAAKPDSVVTRRRFATMDRKGNLLVTPRPANPGRSITYCVDFAPGTKPFVMQRLMTRPRPE